MNCPKCTNRRGEPTKMRRQVIVTGGGSCENRQSGDFHDTPAYGWTCLCGVWIEISDITMPISPSMIRPSAAVMLAEAKKREQKVIQKNEAEMTLKKFLIKHSETITHWRDIGLSWAKISVQLSGEYGKSIPMTTLYHAWAALKLKTEGTDGV